MVKCQIPGCTFAILGFSCHSKYIMNHLKRCHSFHNTLKCMYRNSCPEIFGNLKALEEHIVNTYTYTSSNISSTKSKLSITIPMRCYFTSCGHIQVSSVKELFNHFKIIHKGEYINCIFENCTYSSKSFHGYECHAHRNHANLSSRYLL